MNEIIQKCLEKADEKFIKNGLTYRHDTCEEYEGVYILSSSEYLRDHPYEMGGWGLPEVFNKKTAEYLGNITGYITGGSSVEEGKLIKKYKLFDADKK